jgi:hypothetical protein
MRLRPLYANQIYVERTLAQVKLGTCNVHQSNVKLDILYLQCVPPPRGPKLGLRALDVQYGCRYARKKIIGPGNTGGCTSHVLLFVKPKK